VEAILLVEKDHGSSVHRFNLILEREVGSKSNDETEWGIAWASMWDMDYHFNAGDFEAGFEYYAEFGELGDEGRYSEQKHQIGPVVEFDLPGTEAEMKLGYLAGISRAAFDSTVKWELEWEF
jgi:hypothetical protein